jgi:hypothetical protein
MCMRKITSLRIILACIVGTTACLVRQTKPSINCQLSHFPREMPESLRFDESYLISAAEQSQHEEEEIDEIQIQR